MWHTYYPVKNFAATTSSAESAVQTLSPTYTTSQALTTATTPSSSTSSIPAYQRAMQSANLYVSAYSGYSGPTVKPIVERAAQPTTSAQPAYIVAMNSAAAYATGIPTAVPNSPVAVNVVSWDETPSS